MMTKVEINNTSAVKFILIIAILLILPFLVASSMALAEELPMRPTFAGDIGPFVTIHFLDHAAFNNYVDKFGMDELDPMTIGGGLGWRVLAVPVQISSHLEGWSASTSGNGSDASMWGLSLVGRMGFTLIRRNFLSVLYFGPGLNYGELNINGKEPLPDFSGWKLGMMGDVGISFEYLFPVERATKDKETYSTTIIPVGVQIGYGGEILSDPWYERSGRLLNNDLVRDRFMGYYIRFGINIGGGGYSRSKSYFNFSEDDDSPRTPRNRRRHPGVDNPPDNDVDNPPDDENNGDSSDEEDSDSTPRKD